MFEGWNNYFSGLNVSPEIKNMAERRLAICVECEHFASNKLSKMVAKVSEAMGNPVKIEKSDISAHYCKLCSCQFPQKALSPSSECPDKRWLKEKL